MTVAEVKMALRLAHNLCETARAVQAKVKEGKDEKSKAERQAYFYTVVAENLEESAMMREARAKGLAPPDPALNLKPLVPAAGQRLEDYDGADSLPLPTSGDQSPAEDNKTTTV